MLADYYTGEKMVLEGRSVLSCDRKIIREYSDHDFKSAVVCKGVLRLGNDMYRVWHDPMDSYMMKNRMFEGTFDQAKFEETKLKRILDERTI